MFSHEVNVHSLLHVLQLLHALHDYNAICINNHYKVTFKVNELMLCIEYSLISCEIMLCKTLHVCVLFFFSISVLPA